MKKVTRSPAFILAQGRPGASRDKASTARKTMRSLRPHLVFPGGGAPVIVGQPTSPPYVSICSVHCFGSAGGLIAKGTGWVFARRIVVTAGHVVGTEATGAVRVELRPGWGGEDPPKGGLIVTTKIMRHDQLDLAALIIDQSLPPTSAPLSATAAGDAALLGQRAEIAGYPLTIGGLTPDGRIPYSAIDPIAEYGPLQLRYRIDAEKGESGAPVIVREGPANGRVVGVHLSGPKSTAGSPNHNFARDRQNFCVRAMG